MNGIALQFVLAENSILILMNGKWLPLEVRGIIGKGWFIAQVSVCVCVCAAGVFVWHLSMVCSDPSLKGSLQDLCMGPSERLVIFKVISGHLMRSHTIELNHYFTDSDCMQHCFI